MLKDYGGGMFSSQFLKVPVSPTSASKSSDEASAILKPIEDFSMQHAHVYQHDPLSNETSKSHRVVEENLASKDLSVK